MNFYTLKNVDFSKIQTRNVGVEGEHADLLTTNTAPTFISHSIIQNSANVAFRFFWNECVQRKSPAVWPDSPN